MGLRGGRRGGGGGGGGRTEWKENRGISREPSPVTNHHRRLTLLAAFRRFTVLYGSPMGDCDGGDGDGDADGADGGGGSGGGGGGGGGGGSGSGSGSGSDSGSGDDGHGGGADDDTAGPCQCCRSRRCIQHPDRIRAMRLKSRGSASAPNMQEDAPGCAHLEHCLSDYPSLLLARGCASSRLDDVLDSRRILR
uniref:Uncharacterized protein n=1 Tax=Vespula pensylvanica TaxID=30213 RepID=A0A834KA02_VESPE|nr:hypothetical protein H0235_015272 [Vespula pensylvanica]